MTQRQSSAPPSEAAPSHECSVERRRTPWKGRRGSPHPRGGAPRCRSHEARPHGPGPGGRGRSEEGTLDDADDFVAEYRLERRLSAGIRGTVYLATERSTRRTVVVKKPGDITDTSDYDKVVGKSHPNILRVFECFQSPVEVCVVMEFCGGGDLFRALERIGTPSHAWSASVFGQTLAGVGYLHERFDECHNDLKPENLLLEREVAFAQEAAPRVVIADFDCAGRSGSLTQASGGGDPRYRAPETFRDEPFGPATDVWALGVTLFELLSGGLLIHVNQRNVYGFCAFRRHRGGEVLERYMAMLKSGRRVDVDVVRGDEARDLLRGLLEADPRERLTVAGARSHAWLRPELCRREPADGRRSRDPTSWLGEGLDGCEADDASGEGRIRAAPPAIPTDQKGDSTDGEESPRSPKKWGGC